jgi:hypothetical protein
MLETISFERTSDGDHRFDFNHNGKHYFIIIGNFLSWETGEKGEYEIVLNVSRPGYTLTAEYKIGISTLEKAKSIAGEFVTRVRNGDYE